MWVCACKCVCVCVCWWVRACGKQAPVVHTHLTYLPGGVPGWLTHGRVEPFEMLIVELPTLVP